MCVPCRSKILGRENKCCCLPSGLGLLFIGIINLTLFSCAVLNYCRVVKQAWDPLIYIGLFIAFTRVFFHYATCKDSIGARRRYAWVMFLTTCLEGGMLVWQVSSMLADSAQFCPNPFIPTFKMSCPGALTLIEIMNWSFLFMYLYFTAVTYEYYVRGLATPKLIKLEAAEEAHKKIEAQKAKEEKSAKTAKEAKEA
jgi:hypothetical protein